MLATSACCSEVKVVAAAASIGAVLAGVDSMLSTPQYRATTTLFFYLSGADSTTALLQGSTYAQNQVSSFALLAEQPVVLDPVIKQLNLDETSVQLSKQVTTTVPLDTVVMDHQCHGYVGDAGGGNRQRHRSL